MKYSEFKDQIVFVADIAEDIDDVVAIEYLHLQGVLKCVVLDGKSRDEAREKSLKDMGVIFEEQIPAGTNVVFCGGALTLVDKYIKNHTLSLLVANGGFAGFNVVDPQYVLEKFANKTEVRTYNFNLDIDAALNVLDSDRINQILLVSKNVCHHKNNTIDNIHKDEFLKKYNLSVIKKLHDLLMVKEGLAFLTGKEMLCEYRDVLLYCKRASMDKMSTWGSMFDTFSNVSISVALTEDMQARKHSSKIITDILESITPEERFKTDTKMRIAVNLRDFMDQACWSYTEFANEFKIPLSEVYIWLSGTHNFTLDQLCDISMKFQVDIGELCQPDPSPKLSNPVK